MTDSTPTNPADRGDAHSTGGRSSTPGTSPADEPTTTYPSSPAGWGAAPTPTSTATLEAPAPFSGPTHQYAGDSAYGAATGPYAASWNPGAPNGATPWYGTGATTRRKRGPKPRGSGP
ncbi:hypothetical protein P9139_20830 [Curtobacterium flaccumfaciens]|nr:hypothetical protein P9139_20830 [Curtobacterium flaccumfaciens]